MHISPNDNSLFVITTRLLKVRNPLNHINSNNYFVAMEVKDIHIEILIV